jgi:hypothetical protein
LKITGTQTYNYEGTAALSIFCVAYFIRLSISSLAYKVSNGRVTDEQERIWKEVVTA